MKKVIFIFLTIFLVGCTKDISQSQETIEATPAGNQGCDVVVECEEDTVADMGEYETLIGESHVFIEKTMAEVNQYFEDRESFIVYYGFSSCPWCIEAVPVLNDLAKENNRKVIYVDIRSSGEDQRVETNDEYVHLMEWIEKYSLLDDEGSPRLYVPAVYFVSDGEIEVYNIGTVDSHDAKEREMTEEEIQKLIEIYQSGFDAVRE